MSVYEPIYSELIPGTALPLSPPEAAQQSEGRGDIQLRPERAPRSLLSPDVDPDMLEQRERAIAEAAIRAYDREPQEIQQVFQVAQGETDATTGNIILPLYECPAGMFGKLMSATADLPNSTTITPAAPFSNASSWAFLASSSSSTGTGNASPASLRRGLVAFAPTSTAGPILPGQWSFGSDNAPIIWGGRMLYFVLVGGSVAALTAQTLQVVYNVRLFGRR